MEETRLLPRAGEPPLFAPGPRRHSEYMMRKHYSMTAQPNARLLRRKIHSVQWGLKDNPNLALRQRNARPLDQLCRKCAVW